MKGRKKDNCATKKLSMDHTSRGTMGRLAEKDSLAAEFQVIVTERSLHVIDLHFPEQPG